MSLRSIPPSIDPATVTMIDARLDAIVAEQHVAIPLAIESGSRAWGFPSPDSDYDCCFLYVRRTEDYALRPAAALRWLRLHPDAAVAPMHFPVLMAQCEAPDDVRDLVFDLTAKKAVTHELGDGELPPAIAVFIDAEFEAARTAFESGARLGARIFPR